MGNVSVWTTGKHQKLPQHSADESPAANTFRWIFSCKQCFCYSNSFYCFSV